MRLLNTTTLRVEPVKREIVANEKPPFKYAILSHTWGEDEVVFQDMQEEVPKDNPRFSKIVKSCELAKNDGYDYIWIDTCCIDKSSSAELSEAINSMYLWYSQADICYAYLSDVEPRKSDNDVDYTIGFRFSRWFTRGWTLQELIAPAYMIFLSKDWKMLGDKQEFLSLLSSITSIDYDVLQNSKMLSSISVARKLSWAAKRTTTRVEDRAYSLLGIFDVNMPLLYGEGWKAFTRLQEEILKKIDDESLFANHRPLNDTRDIGDGYSSGSLLAERLDYFLNSGDIWPYDKDARLHDMPDQGAVEAHPLVTSKGLRVPSFGCPCTYTSWGGPRKPPIYGWLMILDCRVRGNIFARPAVFLKPLVLGTNRYTRVNSYTLLVVRRTDNKATLGNWLDKSPFKGFVDTNRPINSESFSPEFDKLQRRTIYVEAEDFRLRNTTRQRVWLRTIVQLEEEETKFETIKGSHGWDEQQRCFSGDVNGVREQLMFGNMATREAFYVVVYLEYQGYGPNNQLQYRVWCKLLEELGPSDLFPEFGVYMDEMKVEFLINKEYTATLLVSDRVTVQAKLGLDDFLGRKEFILTVKIRTVSEKQGKRQDGMPKK